MGKLRFEGVETVMSRCLRGFLDGEDEEVDEWILEDEDPSYFRPIEARLTFFCGLNGGKAFVIERPGGRGILDEKKEQSAVMC